MTANTSAADVKRLFTKNNIGLAVAAVILLAVAVFQFVFAETDGDEGIDEDDTGYTEAVDAAQAQQPNVVYGMFGEPIEAPEDGRGAKAAPRTGSRARSNNPPINPNLSISTRTIDIRTIYFGEDDWNFIGVITLRFILNVLFAYVLICVIFTKEHRVKEFSFSYFVSNILIFMVTSLLASVRVRQGFAFGLFAILSILRFRTEQLQVREMTFLFAALILGVINSLATDGLTIFAILWANIILCMSVYICDGLFMGVTDQINLIYDNTKLLAKDKRKELFEDIKSRFGYDVVNVVVQKMNYLTDSAEVKLVYRRDKKVRVATVKH